MNDGPRTIKKVGLAVVRDRKLLIARKHSSKWFILPGGRPEHGEDDQATLQRELHEELRSALKHPEPEFLGIFTDRAANEPNCEVSISLYIGDLTDPLTPSAEIAEIRWFNPENDDDSCLAASIRNRILPHLLATGRLL